MRGDVTVALLALFGTLGRAGPPANRASHAVTVHIANFAFVPADTAVAQGDTMVWINDDDFEHVVAADSAGWTSPTLTHGQRFVWVAARAGRVRYHCAAHPVMHGAVTIAK